MELSRRSGSGRKGSLLPRTELVQTGQSQSPAGVLAGPGLEDILVRDATPKLQPWWLAWRIVQLLWSIPDSLIYWWCDIASNSNHAGMVVVVCVCVPVLCLCLLSRVVASVPRRRQAG